MRGFLPAGFALLAAFATLDVASAQVMTVDRTNVHPGDAIKVATSQFHEPVDLYFDTHYVGGVMTVPADALPGKHWISAVGRKTGAGAQVAITVNSDWPQLNFDAAGTGSNKHETLLDKKTVKRLALAWSANLGGTAFGLSPVVANGVLYVGSGDKHLNAMDATTGAQLWAAATDAPVESSAAVADGTVYAGATNGRVYAFDATTGTLRWSVMTGGPILSSPVVRDGMVYVSSFNDKIYALDAKNGLVRWALIDRTLNQPVVSHGIVYANFDRGIAARNAKTGQEIFYFIEPDISDKIAVSGGQTYFCTLNGAEAMDAVTGTPLWTTLGSGPCDTLAVDNGRLYFTSSALLFRADVHSGQTDYEAFEHGYVETAPALANGVVYLGGAYNAVSAVKAEDGTLLWSAPDGQEGIPIVANGMLYFVGGSMTDGFNVFAYAVDGGKNAVYHANAQPPSYAALHRP